MKEYSFGVCPYRIKNDNVEVLLCQARGREDWGFIKGKKEGAETSEQCAVRECFEETGIKIDEDNLEEGFLNRNKRKDIEIFLVHESNIDDSNIVLKKDEVQKLKWFGLFDDIKIQFNQRRVMSIIKSKFKRGLKK